MFRGLHLFLQILAAAINGVYRGFTAPSPPIDCVRRNMRRARTIMAHAKVAVFHRLQRSGAIFCLQPPMRDNREMNEWYPEEVYTLLMQDEHRNAAYCAAIAECVANRTVLEIGTGPFAFLGEICARSGARQVFAIEDNPKSYSAARAYIENLGLADKIQFVQGFSTDVRLPKRCQVLVHEIVGSVGSAEGMVRVVIDAKKRLLESDAEFVPHGCETYIVPVAPLKLPIPDALLSWTAGGCARIESRGIYKIFNFPKENLLSQPQAFEQFVFAEKLRLQETTRHSFFIRRSSLFGGFLCFIRLHVSPEQIVDSLAQPTNWSTPFLKCVDQPIALEAGDRIDVEIARNLETTNPSYRVKFRVVRPDSKENERVLLEDRIEWTGN